MKLLLTILLMVSCGFARAGESFFIQTRDGLAIRFQTNQIYNVTLTNSKPISTINGGFWIREVKAKMPTLVHGRFDTGPKISFNGSAEQFEMTAEFSNKGDYIAVDGVVRNRASVTERCADLKFALPIDCNDWQWGADLNAEQRINKTVYSQKTGDGIAIYPLASASSTDLGAGISLAIPPQYPTLFQTGAGSSGLFVLIKLGFSKHTVPANETAFHFIIYRHDPAWGFRASLERYYQFFRDPYFTRHVNKFGAWGWHYPTPSEWSNADLYAFHESAGETWEIKDEGMHGYEHEGKNLATNLADFVRLTRVVEDEKRGIYSLPYTIIGQRQIYRLPTMPKTRDEALAAFTNWTTPEPMLFQSPGPSVSFRNVDQLKEMIRNSCVYDRDQKPDVLIREYLGNTVTFPLNPNPRLFADTTNLTIAKYTLNDYLPMLFNGSKLIDGCYVDSLGRWPGYFNHRQEHFRYTTLPLTYSESAPAIWNLQSHAEYLVELSKQLHAQNRILFANGTHANRVMLGFYVDVLGEEGLPDFTKPGFYAKRVAAFDKPFCALNGRDNTNPRVWNSCLYLGLFIGARNKQGEQLERKYLPIIIRMNEAGWRPVPHARSDSNDVVLERWGDGNGKPLFLSVLNRSKGKVATKLSIDRKQVGLKKPVLHDLLSGKAIPANPDQNGSFPVRLNGETASVFEVVEAK